MRFALLAGLLGVFVFCGCDLNEGEITTGDFGEEKEADPGDRDREDSPDDVGQAGPGVDDEGSSDHTGRVDDDGDGDPSEPDDEGHTSDPPKDEGHADDPVDDPDPEVEEDDCPEDLRDDGVCDECLGDDPDCEEGEKDCT